jgi:hypothetical protein
MDTVARDAVFQPVPGTDAECFIQWKNTELCVDIYCPCDPSTPRHFDGYFAHRLQCDNCSAVYEMGTQVRMRRLADDDPAQDDAKMTSLD